MRILFVTHNVPRFPGDAAGSFVLRLAVALQACGHRVDVIAPGTSGGASHDEIEGVAITRERYGPERHMSLAYTGTMAEQVRSTWSGKLALVRLLGALRRATVAQLRSGTRDGRPYDIVHVHWWFPSGLALWQLRKRGLPPLVITMHGSDVRLALGIPAAQRIMRVVLRQAAVRTAVSTWLADRARSIAPENPISVEPMPVDTSVFAPPEEGRTPSRDGILFVGRLNAQKGLASLLEALSMSALRGARLTVIGDGPDVASLRTKASALDVDVRVRWMGPVAQPNLAAFYREAAVVAIPSLEEGLGLVAVEAQLCETPVVAYDSGGIPDVVRADAGGTLVVAGDAGALATALAGLLGDRDRAAACGRKARAAMLERFAPDAVAQRYTAHYETAVARRE